MTASPESLSHLIGTDGQPVNITFPIMPTDHDDEYANMLAQAVNWQNETLAVTHHMVTEMYGVFAKLKPLVDSMPTLPAGMTLPGMPGMPPGMPPFQRRR